MKHRSIFLLVFMIGSMCSLSQVGMPDHTFGQAGETEPLPERRDLRNILVQQDGKVLAYGDYFHKHAGSWDGLLARYNVDGSLDRSFGKGGILIDARIEPYVYHHMALQSDGKILVTHYAFTYRDGTNDFSEGDDDIILTRLKSNGDFDSSFGIHGQVRTDVGAYAPNGNFVSTNDEGTAIAVQNDGKILLAAMAKHGSIEAPWIPRGALITYNIDGSIHSIKRFYSEFAKNESYPVVHAYPTGGYVLTANTGSGSIYVHSTRFPDKLVPVPAQAWLLYHQSHLLSNNKLVLLLETLDKPSYLVQLVDNGSPDRNFGENGYIKVIGPISMTSLPDNKIILATLEYNITRYNHDGRIDLSFGTNGQINAGALKVVARKHRLYGLYSTISAYVMSTDPRLVKVNLSGNAEPYLHGEWNNWNNLKNLHINNLYYSDSTSSSIKAVMSYRSGINDNGNNYGNNLSMMAPKGVLRHSSYSTTPRTITISGLSTLRTYDLEFYSSRDEHINNNSIFTIGSRTRSVSSYQNYHRKIQFQNLLPGATGQIVVHLSSSKHYNYLNGFQLTEKFTSVPTTMVSEPSEETTVARELESEPEGMSVVVTSNPTPNEFTIRVKTNSNSPVQVQVFDAFGKTKVRQTIPAGVPFSFGKEYRPGVYVLEVVQGIERAVIKLIKVY